MTAEAVPSGRLTRIATQAVRALVLVVVAATPLIVDPRGRDLFRVPKLAFFQTGMLLAAAIAGAAALLSDTFAASLGRHRRPVILACAAVAWVAIASMASTLPAVSHSAPFSVFCNAVLFVLALTVLRTERELTALGALLLPAIANAVIIVLQARDLWAPLGIFVEGSDRFGNIGLIGNANTAGTYLVIPTLAALAATMTLQRWRLLFGAVSAVLLTGLFLTQTITVMFGFGVALVAFAVTGSKRIRLLAIAVVAIGIVGVMAYGPTRERLMTLKDPLLRGEFGKATSNRVPAAVATLDMFLDRPFFGQGPGVFASRYMQYRMAVDERHPQWVELTHETFGEAHNDHAQVLAETGVPGYVLLVVLLLSVAVLTLRRPPQDDERARFVAAFALPAAAGFAGLALGQFPIWLTAASTSCVYAAALCFAWRPDATR
ncbi:MAG TPA: O-antigen ligase family protein [Thermoanaerobaculia bacterium]